MKRLVVFFSATGTTALVAKRLVEATDADLFEIKPEQPYSSDDLKWGDASCRAMKEAADPACRPAIANKVDGIAHYDTVFIGFPVWEDGVPPIVKTFLESYDLSRKNVVPFCTSGGSNFNDGMTKTLEACCDDSVHWGQGLRASANSSVGQLKLWARDIQV